VQYTAGYEAGKCVTILSNALLNCHSTMNYGYGFGLMSERSRFEGMESGIKII